MHLLSVPVEEQIVDRLSRPARGHELAVTIGAQPGVHVDHRAAARGAEKLAANPAEGAVRPGGLAASVVDAVRVPVLALVHRLAHRDLAVPVVERADGGLVALVSAVVPDLRHQVLDQLLEQVVLRVATAFVIHEVAVQIDVVLVLAPQPGHPVGVEGVDQQQRGVGRRLGRPRVAQQADLDPRARESLHPVGRGGHDDHVPGVGPADQGGVREQRLALRTGVGIAVACHRRPRVQARGEEPGAAVAVGRREVVLHHRPRLLC